MAVRAKRQSVQIGKPRKPASLSPAVNGPEVKLVAYPGLTGNVSLLFLISHDSRTEHYAGNDKRDSDQIVGQLIPCEVISKYLISGLDKCFPVCSRLVCWNLRDLLNSGTFT